MARVLLQIFLVAAIGAGYSLAQAPRDEDAKCQRDTYADKEKVLMDSWNYEQLLPGSSNDGTGNPVWSEASCDGNDQINTTFPTNWQQRNGSDTSGGDCRKQAHVCGFRAGDQDNWLFTQYIENSIPDMLNDSYQVKIMVNISFNMQECQESDGCNPRLRLLSLVSKNDERRNTCNRIGDYNTRIHPFVNFGPNKSRPGPDGILTRSRYFYINTNRNGFYVAINDNRQLSQSGIRLSGSCVSITRLVVYRYECPAESVGLTLYPVTPAPSGGTVLVQPQCVENAHRNSSSSHALTVLTCNADGDWDSESLLDRCSCDTGYVVVTDEDGNKKCRSDYTIQAVDFQTSLGQLSWSPVNLPNGVILYYYNIRVSLADSGEVVATVQRNVTSLNVNQFIQSSQNTLRVEIQAVTSDGNGSYSEPVDLTPVDPDRASEDDHQDIIIASTAAGGVLVVSAVLACLVLGIRSCCCTKRIRSKGRFSQGVNDSAGRSRVVELSLAEEQFGVKNATKLISCESKYSLAEESYKMILNTNVFRKEQIRLTDVIGQGEFGQVYKGYLSTSSGVEVVAVKTLKALHGANEENQLVKEIAKMVNFKHRNVMSLTGVILGDEGAPLLIMPYMSEGTVLGYVRYHKNELLLDSATEHEKLLAATKTLLGMSRQIAMGMAYLAENNIVHRDLAARNCMLDVSGSVKVADFGLAEDMHNTNYYRPDKSSDDVDTKLPIRWMSPESIKEGLFTEKSDMWAFGVTIWELFTCGEVPYQGISCMALPNLLDKEEHLEKPQNAACSSDIYSLLETCWNIDPEKRPRFTEITCHIDEMMEEISGYVQIDDQKSDTDSLKKKE